MVLHTTKRVDEKERLKDIQRSILEAYSRGLLSEKQAMHQLGLRNADELNLMLEKSGAKPWESGGAATASGSIADGFASYWRSQNPED